MQAGICTGWGCPKLLQVKHKQTTVKRGIRLYSVMNDNQVECLLGVPVNTFSDIYVSRTV